jgi:hypothetical protein
MIGDLFWPAFHEELTACEGIPASRTCSYGDDVCRYLQLRDQVRQTALSSVQLEVARFKHALVNAEQACRSEKGIELVCVLPSCSSSDQKRVVSEMVAGPDTTQVARLVARVIALQAISNAVSSDNIVTRSAEGPFSLCPATQEAEDNLAMTEKILLRYEKARDARLKDWVERSRNAPPPPAPAPRRKMLSGPER